MLASHRTRTSWAFVVTFAVIALTCGSARADWLPSQPSCRLPPGTKYTAVHYLQKTVAGGDDRCDEGSGPTCQIDLQGVLYEPPGDAKKPVVVFNHGSESMRPFAPRMDKCSAAKPFVERGFIVFIPFRRGHGPSTGRSEAEVIATLDGDAAKRAVLEQLSEQTSDVKAALRWLKSNVAAVHKKRIGVMGLSYGGMVSLLSAVKLSGFQAAIDISGGALSWKGNAALRKQLRATARKVRIPTFMIQDDKECAGADPTRTLGPLLPAGSAYRVYTGFPKMECHDAHSKFVVTPTGQALWLADALAFLKKHGVAP